MDTANQQQYDYEVQRQQWLEEQETQPNIVRGEQSGEACLMRCKCGNPVHPKRVEAGYYWCLECGEAKAKEARTHWCIAPLNKSNYILITDPNDLKGLNPKRTPT